MSWFKKDKKTFRVDVRKLERPEGYDERSCCVASNQAESLTFEQILSRNFSYRSISAVYACIEIISNAMSSMPLRVMREDEHGHKEFVKHHPLQRIFNNKNIQLMSI